MHPPHRVEMSGATQEFRELTQSVSKRVVGLRASAPDAMKAFTALGQAALNAGALDKKTKELIALALGVGARCDPCIGFHAAALVKLGASRQELDEMLAVAVYMGGWPSLMYAASAIAAFDEFAQAAA